MMLNDKAYVVLTCYLTLVACGSNNASSEQIIQGAATGGAPAAGGQTPAVVTSNQAGTGGASRSATGGQSVAGGAGTGGAAPLAGGSSAQVIGGATALGGTFAAGGGSSSATTRHTGGQSTNDTTAISGTAATASGGLTSSGGTIQATGAGTASGGAGGVSPSSGGATSVGGSTAMPSFTNEDQEILYKSVRFYGAERCGENHNWTLVDNPVGHSCHMRDGEAAAGGALDLTGGWHDAGDHVKVTLTIAYAAYMMLKAYETYPSAFGDYDDPNYSGLPNGIPDVLDEARFGLDWLIKIQPDSTHMVAMVANSDYDHATFMTSPTASKNDPTQGGDPRPVQVSAKADFAGSAAAALALASRVYQSFDATQASVYLAKAKTAYTLAKANPGLSTSMLYAWSGMQYTDDLMCGATELWRATNDSSYRTDALNQNTSIGPTQSVASYGQISDFC